MTRGLAGDARAIKCPVCLESFKNPKCLPCIHTFCLECLEKHGENEGFGDEIPCPLCFERFTIPDGGLQNVAENIFIEEMRSGRILLEAERKCDICDAKYATKYCVECAQSTCNKCFTQTDHAISGTALPHKIVIVSEEEVSQVHATDRPTHCGTHEEQLLELYCCDCDRTICSLCRVLQHKAHLCIDLETSSQKFRDELKRVHSEMKENMEAIQSEQESLNKNESDFLEQITECEQKAEQRREELKRLIDAHCSEVFMQLNEVKITRGKQIQARIDEVERELLTMESFVKYTEVLVTKGSAYVISQSAKDLLDRMRDLNAARVKFSKGSLKQYRVAFEASLIHNLVSGHRKKSLIGSLSVNGKIEYSKESVLVAFGPNDGCQISVERRYRVETTGIQPVRMDSEAAACVVGNSLFVVGIGRESNELWKWNAASFWQKCENLITSRCRHCVEVIDSTLYVLGGWSESNQTALSSVEAFNMKTNKWSAGGQLTHAVWASACVSYTDSIYVFGGVAGGNDVSHVQVYDAAQQKCMLMQNAMPKAYSWMRAVLWKTSAFLIGCETCFIYEVEDQTWQERSWYGTGLRFFGLAVDEQKIYIAGGSRSQRKRNKTDTLTDAVCSVSVNDMIKGNEAAGWQHHATLPQPSMIHVISPVPIKRFWTTTPRTAHPSLSAGVLAMPSAHDPSAQNASTAATVGVDSLVNDEKYDMRRVDRAKLNQLRNWLDQPEQEWARQFYTGWDAFYISVRDDVTKSDVIQMLKDINLWKVQHLRIKLIDPFKVSFEHTADNGLVEDVVEWRGAAAAREPRNPRVTLSPSSVLSTAGNGQRTLFGGVVRTSPTDERGGYGLTAASLFNRGIDQEARFKLRSLRSNVLDIYYIGKCSQILDEIKKGSLEEVNHLTAAVALINLNRDECNPDNVIRIEDEHDALQEYRVYTLRDQTLIQNGILVEFVNENARKQRGRIYADIFSDRDNCLHNVILIERMDGTPRAISHRGDSGALVMLSQAGGVFELPVIGMLIGICEIQRPGEAFREVSVSNSLIDILQHMFTENVEFADG